MSVDSINGAARGEVAGSLGAPYTARIIDGKSISGGTL